MATPKEIKELRVGKEFNKKVKSIHVKFECEECHKVSEVIAHVKPRRYVCDCDYPCNCENGTFYFLVAICPHCSEENTIFSLK